MEKKLTMSFAGLVVCISVIVVGIIDLVLVLFTGSGSSISNFMIQAGFKAPFVVFALGYVAGHLTAYMKLESTDSCQHSEEKN